MSFKLSIETRFLYQVVNIISNAVKLCILIKKKRVRRLTGVSALLYFIFFIFLAPGLALYLRVNFGCYMHAEQIAYFHPFKIWYLCFIQKARKISDCFLSNGPLLL